MKGEAITLSLGNSILHVVPAIHYRLSFAVAMNRICVDSATRPEAVAVEIGPAATSQLAAWIRELNAHTSTLPAMFGLLAKNTVIPPSLKDKAIRLQKRTGCDLSELPPDLLNWELGFYSDSILPLSPTDSIIEGVRCALAYDLPLYGIDLESSADEEQEKPFIFPSVKERLTVESLECYADIASHLSKDQATYRREFAMAARLKTLLQRHGTVLFTCGMAHWKRIRALLTSPEMRPALVPECPDMRSDLYRRVVVDPQNAVRFMDTFPAMANAWEVCRLAYENKLPPDPKEIFRTLLQKTYSTCLNEGNCAASLEKRLIFEGYLNNLAMLEHRAVPDIYLTMAAAHETMEPDFIKTLTRVVMDYPWVNRHDYPQYGLVADSEKGNGEMKLFETDEREERFIRPAKQSGPPVTLIYRSEIEDKEKPEESRIRSFSWLPWDRLVTISSMKAIAISNRRTGVQTLEFNGTIMDGIDIKATVRSHARGNASLFVREQVLMEDPQDDMEGFPVVWIFNELASARDYWSVQVFANYHLRPHVRDLNKFDKKVGSAWMIPIIGYSHRLPNNENSKVDTDLFSGMTVYHPTCFSNRQQAIWLEQTGYRNAPIYEDNSIDYHFQVFMERFSIDLQAYDWKTVLILSAIPYAASSVTVVAPDGFVLSEIVLQTARRFNVDIRLTLLSRFDDKDVKRLAKCHFAPCLSLEPIYLYSAEVERAIGELQTDYLHQIPVQIRDYGQFA